jgi:hypothetical protein
MKPGRKWAVITLLAVAALVQSACGTGGVPPAAKSGIVGKWRSADGSYDVEFLQTGDCSARLRMDGRQVGGPCKYSVDEDTITIRYYGPDSHPQEEEPNNTATWNYSLAGDVLNVSYGGNSVALQRVH